MCQKHRGFESHLLRHWSRHNISAVAIQSCDAQPLSRFQCISSQIEGSYRTDETPRGRGIIAGAMIFAALLIVAYWVIWFLVDRNLLAEQIRATWAERDDVTQRLEHIKGIRVAERAVAEKVHLTIQMRTGDPRPGEPGWDAAFSAAITRMMETERGKAVVAMTADLTYEDKRSLLHYLGVRVEVYSKEHVQPDGTHWRLTFAGSNEPQPPLPPFTPTDREHKRQQPRQNRCDSPHAMRDTLLAAGRPRCIVPQG